MKLHRILTLPFAFVADAATLGNIGAERSFTQQVFDAEERDRRERAAIIAAAEAVRLLRAAAGVRENGNG